MYKTIMSVVLILMALQCWGEENRGLLATPLEEFAHRSNVNIIFAQEAAHISSDKTSVTITAIVLETEEQPIQEMRGIRVNLANEKSTDQVYLDAQGISEVLSDVKLLRQAIILEGLENEEVYGMKIRGTGSRWCLHPKPLVHTLCPEYYRTQESSGIMIRPVKGTTNVPWFLLSGHKPVELEDAINAGVLILDNIK
ncbi:MAG: hypothetical protein GKR93_01695 [Gammaproteobacteria bacterium]|nr:hypothetical protein [Gammaproteobacteria bacterium]